MLFKTEKKAIAPQKLFANVYDAMFLSGAVLGFGSSLMFATTLDQVSKAVLTTVGLGGAVAYTLNAKATERVRKLDKALSDVQWESTTGLLKEEKKVCDLENRIIGTQRLVNTVLQTDPHEWGFWANEAGVIPNMPPVEYLTGQDVEQPTVKHRTVETNEVTFEEELPNLPKKLADDMRNTLIVGVPGSGKGLFVSNCLAYVQDRADTTVFYLDPKNDDKESGYFMGRVDHLYRLPGGNVDAEPEDVKKWLEKSLKAYDSFKVTKEKPRKLLVIDELTGIMEVLEELGAKDLKWFKRKINLYVSSGDSRGINLWGIGQNGHNTGLGMDGGEKSQLTPIAIIYGKQATASQGLQKADFIPGDQKLASSEIQAICRKSPIDRAIFHGGLNEWYPMPVLPNPSGYDRDSRTQINSEEPEQEESEQVKTVIHEEPIAPIKTVDQLMAEMMEWMQTLDELPDVVEVKTKWESLSGKALKVQELKAILKGLGLES